MGSGLGKDEEAARLPRAAAPEVFGSRRPSLASSAVMTQSPSAIGPPTGTVTFLFTDIEGSTERWDRHPDAMRAALERHDALLRAAVAEQAGFVFKTVGDAFCVAFATAGTGLAAAIAAQRAIHAEDWSAFGEGFAPLHVRMGLHTGEATEREGDYYGQPVNRVARLEAAGHGGQVLLSGVMAGLVREHLPPGVALRDWGEHRLKDLRHSEHIYQVEGPGFPAIDAPPTTAEALHPRERVRVVDPADADEGDNTAGRGVVEGSMSIAAVRDRGADGSDTTTAPDSPWARLAAAITSDEGVAATLTPAEATALARHKPTTWREWRLGRIAEWSQPRYRLDGRFVGLTLLIDQGEDSVAGRWSEKEERYGELADLLAEIEEPAVVVLGPPGSGKSTLLRRLELDGAIAGLRGEAGVDTDATRGEGGTRDPHSGDGVPATFFVSLSAYKPARPGDPPPVPGEWLSERWSARHPALPSLDALIAAGRVTLLLDALNEMPAESEAAFRTQVGLWKDWLVRLTQEHPGNRVVFSCRSLDYSQPLSTPELRVPQVRVEPLDDERVREFLALYSPARWREVWAELEGSPQLEVLRSPYFLALLVEQVEATGEMPAGRAALFTGFVRQALRREVERGNALFEPGELLASRDLKRLTRWRWKTPYDLPERGALLPKLAGLAHAMQDGRAEGERSQVCIDVDDALDLLAHEADEAILEAGQALAVLDEDQAAEELMYVHQLVQEYFAARALTRKPDPELVRTAWRAADVSPTVDEVLDSLDPADPLPGPAQTGWEETTLLAAAMAKDAAGFVRGVAEVNVVLAGRAAALPEVRERLPVEQLDELRWELVKRSREPAADLRHRIACGYVLGVLGDPRYERREGPHGAYLLPPLVQIAGGVYPIGGEEPIVWSVPGESGESAAHLPRHEVAVAGFRAGKFPVTNAEWACFTAAGGYEEERWWETADAKRWRRGELANEGAKWNNRLFRKRFLADPELFEQLVEEGRFENEEAVERWRGWMELDEAGFEATLAAQWRPKREVEPAFWRDDSYNGPTQPVVGVSWYEARAYCAWLSAQTGLDVRLPREVEWEAAAAGREGRRYAWGDQEERWRANLAEARVRRTSPVGVFVEGDSAEGVADLGGNVHEWTTSLFGEVDEDDLERPTFSYPYEAGDGREDVEAPPRVRRVVRGGGGYDSRSLARAAFRDDFLPDDRGSFNGLRVVVSGASPIVGTGH